MLTTSKSANINYLCKVISIDNLTPIDGADRIQKTSINFGDVVVSKEVQLGDVMVYFPIESKISADFLHYTNSFRDKTKNADISKVGFFDDSCRVKAIKMIKGSVKSTGYLVPVNTVADWLNIPVETLNCSVGTEFDTINGKLIVEKYQIPVRQNNNTRQGKKPKLSRLVEGQVHLHIDTENLRKNSHKVLPDDIISITYKTHGTSWWVSNVLVKRKLTLLERISKFFGANIQELEYDLVYGSRKVVKNADLEDPKAKDHFFGYDIWKDIKNEIGGFIPKGFTLYGEMLGYDKNGKAIQNGYDYGCKVGEHKLEIYRITNTTPDGLVTELSYPEIKAFCDRVGLTASHLFYYGKARGWFDFYGKADDRTLEAWQQYFIMELENKFTEKDCFICTNKVPEEGVVVRVEDLFECKSYKLKSFRFLEWESKELDKGVSDVESEN